MNLSGSAQTLGDPPRERVTPRVAIAHDYLTQRGGAERVVLELMRAFPDAPVYTSVYEPESTFEGFADADVRTSRLSHVAAFRRDPRLALPVLARSWSRTEITGADVVICSSSGWAHGVSTAARKIVYCHNPARWLYQADEYLADRDPVSRTVLKTLNPSLRRWDRRNALSADRYLVNSRIVAERVRSAYGLEAEVVHPPVSVMGVDLEPVPGIEPGFLLTVGRARGYKNADIVARAVAQLPGERLVAVGGVPDALSSGRIVGLNDVTDGQLRWLYHNADALVACGFEDFGLTVIESFAVGTPAICLRAGGYLDTMVEHVTGEFIEAPSTFAVMDAVQKFRRSQIDAMAIREHAQKFSAAAFAARIRDEVDLVLGRGVAVDENGMERPTAA